MNQNIYINEIPSAELTIYDNGTPVTVVIANGAVSQNKVPYTGATQNVNLGEYGISAGFVQLDTTPTTYTPAVGNIGWNDSEGTIDLLLKGGVVSVPLGQKQVARVVNGTGGNVLKSNYQVVKVTGAQGQRLQVNLAQANNDANSADTLGLIAENINNNNSGFIITSGLVENINTTGSLQSETWTDGNILYLSPTTPGAITNVKPQAPNHTVIVGFVVYAHANNGKIYCKIDNGYELEELHNVLINTGTLANGQVLKYNSSLQVWENNTDAAGTGTVTSITASSPLTGGTITTSGTIGIPQATSSVDGYLSSTDWTTFNNKQNALTNPVTGTGTSGQVAYWNGTTTQTGSNNLFWDNANGRLGIGTNSPSYRLHIVGTGGSSAFNSGDSNDAIRVINRGFIAFSDSSDVLAVRFRGISGAFQFQDNLFNIKTSISTSNSLTYFNNGGGNVHIGGTTDSGQRLQVTGTTLLNGALTVSSGGAAVTGLSSFTGTTASDGGQLGSELLSSANWTLGAGWTGDFVSGFAHSSGTATLTNTLAAVNGTYYQIAYTVTNRTTGSFTIAFGGYTSGNLTATGSVGPRATSTGTVVITPTTDFNGTIVLSIKVISASSASIQLRNSAGTITNEIRNDSSNTNTLIGTNAGSRNLGTSNTFIGGNAGLNNTTGLQNIFIGRSSGSSNTIGSSNTFVGNNSGNSNIVGNSNSYFGNGSGQLANADNNSYFGAGTGVGTTTGSSNSFFGSSVANANTTGSNNSFFGSVSGYSNNGSGNSFFGYYTAFSLSTGNNNTILGNESGRFISSGSNLTSLDNSVLVGSQARVNANSETNQTVIGYQAIGLGSNTTVIGNSSTTFGRWWGNLLIGSSVNSGQALQVTGDTLLKGSGNTSGTTALTVQNSDGTQSLAVRNDGVSFFGISNNYLSISNNSAGTNPKIISGFWNSGTPYGIQIQTNLATDTAVGNGYGVQITNAFGYSYTSGTYSSFNLGTHSFRPTSGTGVFNALLINHTINQTGGANGITRGLYVNPTLTAAADWRSIEWSNNTGWGLYGAGTANNYVAGNLSIATTNTPRRLNIQVANGSTAAAIGLYTGGSLTSVIGLESPLTGDLQIASNSAIRFYSGSIIGNIVTDPTNERARLFSNGNFAIGTTTDAGFKLDVNGTARIQNDLTISDTRNIILATTTGTKIGTATSQKLGFWNATPIVQPTTGVASATRVGGGGTTLTDTDTFDGYTLAQIVKALRNTGILA